jgi:hypothetical protein
MNMKKEKINMKSQSLIPILILIVCFCLLPKAQAVSPPPDGGYPGFNTAEGDNALKSLNTATGIGNTAVGWFSLGLVTDSSFNTGVGVGALVLNTGGSNTGIGAAALILNTTGERNTAVGTAAMVNNDVGNDNTAVGDHALTSQTGEGPNTAVGSGALFSNTTGINNTANGTFALFGNTEGTDNTATGSEALVSNIDGSQNTAIGFDALFSNTGGFQNTANGAFALVGNTDGFQNTAIGRSALSSNTSGDFNTALGFFAGANVTTADHVIAIGANGANVSNSCFIGNIRDVQTANDDAIPVLIDSAGQLGTASSSHRFKKEIKPMGKASETILALKPVTFHYKNHKSSTPQFGLIAEEVAEVNPDLVVRDKNGEIYTVRYDAVNAMLLNEFLKEHRKVEEQEATIARQQREFQRTAARQDKEIQVLTAELKEQAAQIQNVSARIELNRPAPEQVVLKVQ